MAIDHESFAGMYARNFQSIRVERFDHAILDGHRWSIFTLQWPCVAFAALVGRE